MLGKSTPGTFPAIAFMGLYAEDIEATYVKKDMKYVA